MTARFPTILLVLSLFQSIWTLDRFFPGRLDKSPRDMQLISSSFLRTLADDPDAYQAKIEASNVTTDLVTARLRGDTELGYYYITLFFGTPLQRQTLIVDTGSVTTTIPCIECGSNCGPHHFNKPFDRKTSSSFQEFKCLEKFGRYVCNDCTDQCSFNVAYVEGSSYSGHFEKDYMAFGNEIEDLYDILLDPNVGNGSGRRLQDSANNSESSGESSEQAKDNVNTQNDSPVPQNTSDTPNPEATDNTKESSENKEISGSSSNSNNIEKSNNSTVTEGEPSSTNEEASNASGGTPETVQPSQDSNVTDSNKNTEPTSNDQEGINNPGNATETSPSNEPDSTGINQNSTNAGQVTEPTDSKNEPTTLEKNESSSIPPENKTDSQNESTNSESQSETTTSENSTNTEGPINTTTQTNSTASMIQAESSNISDTKSSEVSSNTTSTSSGAVETKDSQSSTNEGLTEEQKSKLKDKEFVQDVIKHRKAFMPFGCTVRETKLFYNQEADGILGLGINTDTNGSPPNVIDTMHRNNPRIKKAFSLCLAQLGGYFTSGGYNFAYHEANEKIYYTDYYDNYGQYRVHLSKIEVQGKDIGLSSDVLNHGEGAFFDSGTTLTHVPMQTYSAIKSGLYDFCTENKDMCGRRVLTESFCFIYDPKKHATVEDFLKSFPTFTFYFGRDGSAKYEWKGEDYLTRKGEAGKYCMGISHYERETILGGTFMKNHDIMFDKENRKIAFVRADCDAINFVTRPTYLYSTKVEQKGQNSVNVSPHSDPDSDGYDSYDSDEDDSSDNTNTVWSQVKGFVIFVLVGGVIGLIIFVVVKFIKRKTYNSMQNEIEIPEAKGAALSFESNIMPDPEDGPGKAAGGTNNTINSLVEASI